MALRLVMMGTGSFALPTFLGLFDTVHKVVGLVTQPDRMGRGHHRHVNLMKEAAIERGTDVFQPDSVNQPESLEHLKTWNADLFVVAAYGQILSADLLSIPRLGAINVHGSLLPKYRGAAPVQYAIWKGETETGVTIFQIEPKLDAGPMLAVEKISIGPKETSGELLERLAEITVPLTVSTIDKMESGTADAILQESADVTRAPRLKKSDGLIDWTQSSSQIDCQVRAMQPWPKASTYIQTSKGRPIRLIVFDVDCVDGSGDADPGTIIASTGDDLVVKTGDAAVQINRVQPEGKRPMSATEFLRGHPLTVGDRLTSGALAGF